MKSGKPSLFAELLRLTARDLLQKGAATQGRMRTRERTVVQRAKEMERSNIG